MVFSNNLLLGAVSATAADAYLIEQSLLFNLADSAYLNRTPSSTGDTKTWTFSAWVKFASGTNYNMLMGHRRDGGGAATQTQVARSSSGVLMFFNSLSGSVDANLSTEALFRDASAWYHIVYIVDTTEATDTNRVKIIVNGTQQTIAAGADWPALNATTRFNEASRFMYVGALNDAADNPYLFHDGLMAEAHFVDGTAVAANNFGETDDNGFWNPIEYTGSYGTNGFQLKFADTSAFGDDTSGNTNDYTSNNFTASDQLADTPTDSADDGIGNFSTLNPNDASGSVVLSEGNLKATIAPSAWHGIRGTIGSGSGKVYFEVTDDNGDVHNCSGIASAASILTNSPGTATQNSLIFNVGNFYKYDGTETSSGTTTTGQIRGHAFDLDAGEAWYAINNVWQNSGNPSAGTGAIDSTLPTDGTLLYPVFRGYSTSAMTFNFGQKPFAYTPPTGFSALATQNLLSDNPLYTGTAAQYRAGATIQSITLNANSGGNTGYTFRSQIPSSAIATQNFTKVRIKMEASTAGDIDIDAIYIDAKATSGNAWDYQGTQVALTLNGDGAFNIPTGGSLWSDWVELSDNGADGLVVGFDIGASNGDLRYTASGSGYSWHIKAATDAASVTAPAGLSTTASYCALVTAIEVQ